MNNIASKIDSLLEIMWKQSPARTGLNPDSRQYKYQRMLFIRSKRPAIELAAA